MIVKPEDGQSVQVTVFHQGHPGPQAGVRFLETPTEGEGVFCTEVVEPAGLSVDVDLVIPLHDEAELAEQGFVGSHAILSAKQVAGPLDLKQRFVGLLGQLKALPLVRGVEEACPWSRIESSDRLAKRPNGWEKRGLVH